MKNSIFFLTAVITTLAACTKHKDDVAEQPAPVQFSFTAPAAGIAFRIGDSVSVQGVAIAPATLHGYDLVIRKALDTTVFFSKHIHDHNDTLTINQKWKADLNAPTNLEAQITFAIDHDGHTFTQKIGFSIQ